MNYNKKSSLFLSSFKCSEVKANTKVNIYAEKKLQQLTQGEKLNRLNLKSQSNAKFYHF